MIYLSFFIGFLIYSLNAYMSYHKGWQTQSFYFPLGMAIGLISSFMWLWVSKLVVEPSRLVKIGLYWDVMMTLCFLFIPVLLFNAKLSAANWLGVILILGGIVLTKI